MARRKAKPPREAVTVINLPVNGNLVPFTFCGHPTVEHMEATRVATENHENAARRLAAKERSKKPETPQQKSKRNYALREKSYG